MKKVLWFSLIVLMVSMTVKMITNIPPSLADSGWDSDYSSSSSDWGSSSSSSDWGDSSGGSSGGSDELTLGWAIFITAFCSPHYYLFAFLPISQAIKKDEKDAKKLATILLIARIVCMILLEIKSPYFVLFDFIFLFVLAFGLVPILYVRSSRTTSSKYDQSVSEDILSKYGLSSKELESEFYQKFVDIQNAWMNFDYDVLKKLCSDELYRSYQSDLEVLKAQNGQNIMNSFHLIDFAVLNVKEKADTLVVGVRLYVSFYDYVIDQTTQKVTRGNKKKLFKNDYYLEFVRDNSFKEVICPNCGAKVTGNVCDHCGSNIPSISHEFVLNAKRIIK